jgi:AbrB family transcriptional regulator, transcriptional pleiotropic regulator of transition state genes
MLLWRRPIEGADRALEAGYKSHRLGLAKGKRMKSTGVVRKIDELGRIVLPSELRRVFGIREGDELEISVDGEKVILQKRQDVCLFCGGENPGIQYKGRFVCESCAGELGQQGHIEVRLPEDETISTQA